MRTYGDCEMSVPKLPKQWLHWARKMKLYPHTPRCCCSGYYLIGRGRYWRVCCNGEFDMSEKFSTFDRWANSCELTHPTLPKTEAEFISMINSMLGRKCHECR